MMRFSSVCMAGHASMGCVTKVGTFRSKGQFIDAVTAWDRQRLLPIVALQHDSSLRFRVSSSASIVWCRSDLWSD